VCSVLVLTPRPNRVAVAVTTATATADGADVILSTVFDILRLSFLYLNIYATTHQPHAAPPRTD